MCLMSPCRQGQALSVVLPGGHDVDPVPVLAELIYSDPTRDIAVARVNGWPRNDGLLITADDQLVMNTNILTIEYSEPDRGIPRDDGRPRDRYCP